MQTFLPYKSFKRSAKILDRARLGKQRLESYQLIEVLVYGVDSRWFNHPACRMWVGYEAALVEYYNTILKEWENRGYQNIKLKHITPEYTEPIYPWWLGLKEFHDSHKSNLLRKDPKHYSIFAKSVSNNLPYYWPTKEKLSDS
jgi:hypothetical protein